MPDKLIKNVAIARSGVYRYLKDELPNLGLGGSTPPASCSGLGFFNVYRPATVLARAVGKFVRLPLTLEHPNEMVDGNNFKKFAVGFTGDTATIDMTKDNKEVTVRSTLAIVDNSAVRAYYQHVVEVSPGYNAVFDWEDGTAPSGEKYQIVMKEVTDVNHLALTRHGRGGSAACILDSGMIGDSMRKSGLIYAVRKLLGVKDASKSFGDQVKELIADRSKLSDEDIIKRVDLLKDSIADLPESDNRAKLSRFIEDMGRIKEESDESATKIGEIVNSIYGTLDSEAMKEVADAEKDIKNEDKEKHEKSEEGEKNKEKGEAKDDKDIDGMKKAETEMSKGEKEEKGDDKKLDKAEKSKSKEDQPPIHLEKENEKEHKEAADFHEKHAKGETIDAVSAIFDKEGDISPSDTKTVLKFIVDTLVANKEEPVKDSFTAEGTVKKVLDSFRAPSAFNISVENKDKATGTISTLLGKMREGK